MSEGKGHDLFARYVLVTHVNGFVGCLTVSVCSHLNVISGQRCVDFS